MARGMKYRMAVAMATLGVSAAMAAQPPHTESVQARLYQDAPVERVLRVIPLRHTDAHEFAGILHTIIDDASSLLSLDERTNSIILLGTPEWISRVQDLVDALDVEVEPRQVEEVRVYPLEYAAARGPLIAAIGEIFSVPEIGTLRLRLSVDPDTNQVIAGGSVATLEQLGEVLESIDRPARREQGSGEISVRLLWLTTEATRDLPPDMADVADALHEIGIDGLGLAAQTLIRATSDSTFATEFTAGAIDPWLVSFEGTAQARDDGDWVMEVAIQAHQARVGPDEIRGSINLQTRLTTEAGHFVVLGVAPIRDVDSVFVLQIVEAQ